MRKLVFGLIVLITFSAQAQKEMNLTAEQAATLHIKEMTLKLDLNEKQQKQVYAMAIEHAEKREAMRKERKERKEMSDEQRYEAKLARLDHQIEMKAKMKAILNEQQFEQWKRVAQKRKQQMEHKKTQHKKKSKVRERKSE